MYEELVKRLRARANREDDYYEHGGDIINEAADAIEELSRAAKSMHTWIFLNSGNEQEAYDECGLTDKMNVALGYGGQYIVEPTKEETK